MLSFVRLRSWPAFDFGGRGDRITLDPCLEACCDLADDGGVGVVCPMESKEKLQGAEEGDAKPESRFRPVVSHRFWVDGVEAPVGSDGRCC